ncbi:MAG: RNA polymerase sigma-70 factor [Bacteroidales bacterium]|nr:RNA polymerase sigma-70 factor [Bacteroidales bacterium]
MVQLELLDNSDVLVGLRNGDEQVFEDIFRAYYERLCNYANTVLNDMNEAEEMVQGTFLTVWEKHETIDIHTSIKSYLYRAVYNCCLNKLKHYKVRKLHGEEFKNQSDILLDDASQNLVEIELNSLVAHAVDLLPKQCKHVFKLSRFENLTYSEIAEQLNISVKTVENHMAKALKILRKQLKDYLPVLVWLFFMRN